MKAHFFVSRRAPRYIHELSELSFRSVWMMFRDKEKYIEHERNGKLVAGMAINPLKRERMSVFVYSPRRVRFLLSRVEWQPSVQPLVLTVNPSDGSFASRVTGWRGGWARWILETFECDSDRGMAKYTVMRRSHALEVGEKSVTLSNPKKMGRWSVAKKRGGVNLMRKSIFQPIHKLWPSHQRKTKN